MEVTISWRDSKKHRYADRKDCPLFHALKKARVDVREVLGWDIVLNNGKWYHFDHHAWDANIQRWSASRHRSVKLEILGLEKELPVKLPKFSVPNYYDNLGE